MKLETARDAYYTFSKSLSEVNRYLCLAGVGIIWTIKTDPAKSGHLEFTRVLLTPLGMFVLSLALDIVQYLYASAAWGLTARRWELKGVKDDQEIIVNHFINWPTNICFWGKALFCVSAYGLLVCYLLGQL